MCFLTLTMASGAPVHIGTYRVYKNDDMKTVVAEQTMVRNADGSLSYEGQGFYTSGPNFLAHGVNGKLQNGNLVWDHGYTSVPSHQAGKVP